MAEAAPGVFKGQPWLIFDTVVSPSFLLGDPNGLAIGTQIPAISASGEMVFLSAGRTRSAVPQYTNMDINGQLSYGMNVWQIYLRLFMPIVTPNQNTGFDHEIDAGVAPTEKLAESIINFGILELDLGQEEQVAFPCCDFKAAGGLVISNSIASASVQNSIPQDANILKLAEPIQCPRTQNITAKIRVAPEARAMIGTVAAPGVGSARAPYVFSVDAETQVELEELPYGVQLGLVGQRLKKSQYGQVPEGSAG